MSEFDNDDVRQGTEGAMKLLNATHADKIAWASHLAVKLAKANLSVHSRMVRAEMVKEGIIPETGGGKEFWLGAVFANLRDEGVLEKAGFISYGDASRNIHERQIAVWKLTKNHDAMKKYADAPPRPKAAETP